MSSFWEPDVQPVLHFQFDSFAVNKAANENRNCRSSLNNKLITKIHRYNLINSSHISNPRNIQYEKLNRTMKKFLKKLLAPTINRTKNMSRINVT